MMGGSTKIGIGRTTRVNAVSMIAWGRRWEHCAHASFQILQRLGFNFPFHEIRTCAEWRPGAEQEIMNLQPPSRLQIGENIPTCLMQSSNKKQLTCLAAILDDPTTFPLLSRTSTPSDSSLCLIRPTLQMFALAGERKAASINWIQFYRTRTDTEDKSYNHREHLIP